jgi:hypothetical protein
VLNLLCMVLIKQNTINLGRCPRIETLYSNCFNSSCATKLLLKGLIKSEEKNPTSYDMIAKVFSRR